MRNINLHVVYDYFVYEIVAWQSLRAVVRIGAPGKDDWLQLFAVCFVCFFLVWYILPSLATG